MSASQANVEDLALSARTGTGIWISTRSTGPCTDTGTRLGADLEGLVCPKKLRKQEFEVKEASPKALLDVEIRPELVLHQKSLPGLWCHEVCREVQGSGS